MRSTQGTTVPSVSFWECTVFQTKVREHQKKIQPFEVSVRNVITGKSQTLTHLLVCLQELYTYKKFSKKRVYPPPLALKLK